LVVVGDVTGYSGSCIRTGFVGVEIDFFVLERLPESLDEDVVALGDFAVHADPDVVTLEHVDEVGGGELASLIGVEDLRRAVERDRLLDRLDAEIGRERVREPPRQNAARASIHEHEEIQKAETHWDIGYVGSPAALKLR
jgi:hypothetical protein